MILFIFITHKKGNNIYWNCSPKKYYDIKEDKIHSTINATIKDIKMKFNIYTSTTPRLSTIKWSNICE